jgi:hypothetical protein
MPPEGTAVLDLTLLGISIKDETTAVALKIRDSIKGIMDAAVNLEQTVTTKAKSFWDFFTGGAALKPENVAAAKVVEQTQEKTVNVLKKTLESTSAIRKEAEQVWEHLQKIGDSVVKWVVGLATAYLSFKAIKGIAEEIWEVGKKNEEVWTKFAGITGSAGLASKLNSLVETMGLAFPTEKAETFQNILARVETQGFGAINLSMQKMRGLISAAAGEGTNLQDVFDQAYEVALGQTQNMEPFFNKFRAIMDPDELRSKLAQAAPGYMGFWTRMNVLTEEFTRAYPHRIEVMNASVGSLWTRLGRHIESIKLAIMGDPVPGTFYGAIRETINKVVTFIEHNTPRIRAFAAQIGQFFKAIWSYIDDIVSSILRAGQRMLGGSAETMNTWVKQQVLPLMTWLILWTGKIKDFAGYFLEGFKKPFVWFWEATKPIREGIGGLIDKIFDSGEKAGEATEKFNAWCKAFETLGVVVGSLVLLKGLQVLISTIGSITSLSPTTLVIAGLAAASWGLYEAWNHDWMGLRTAFVDSFKGVGEDVKGSFDFLKDMKISFSFRDLEPALKGSIKLIADFVAGVTSMFLGLGEIVSSFYNILTHPYANLEERESYIAQNLKGWEMITKGLYHSTVGAIYDMGKTVNATIDEQALAAVRALPGLENVEDWESVKSQLATGATSVSSVPQGVPYAPTEVYIPPQYRDYEKLTQLKASLDYSSISDYLEESKKTLQEHPNTITNYYDVHLDSAHNLEELAKKAEAARRLKLTRQGVTLSPSERLSGRTVLE